MVILHMVALAKLNLAATSAHVSVTPSVAALVWPFLLKISLSFRPFHESCTNLFRSSRLFFFQLAQITFDTGDVGPVGLRYRNRRWDRALRLVSERVTLVRRSRGYETDGDSLYNLSMLTL